MSGPNPVVVHFVCKGIEDTLKAIRSISDAVNQTEKKSTAVAQAGASDRTKAAQKEAKAVAGAAVQTSQMIAAAQKAGTKSVEQELKTRLQNQTTHLKALYDKQVATQDAITAKSKKNSSDVEKTKEAEFRKLEKLTEQWKKGELSAIDSVSKARQNAANASAAGVARQLQVEQGRARNEMLRGGTAASPQFSPQARLQALASAQGKSLEEQRSILDKVAGMREQAQGSRASNRRDLAEHEALETAKSKKTEQAEKERLSIRERSASMAGAFAAKQASEDASKREAFAKTVTGAGGRVLRNTGIAAGVVAGGLFRGATDLGGGFSVESSVQDRLNLERQASLLSNVAMVPGHEARPDPKNIVSSVNAAATRTGTNASELMAGLHAYVAKSADYSGGMKNLDFFGKIAKSTGSSVDEVMRTAGTLSVQNKELQGGERLGDEGMKKLLLSTVMQARQGSVEFSDMAKAGGKITRSAGMYVGDQADNQRKLLGLSQIGMRTAGNDVSEAATVLANVQADATTHSAGVEKLLGRKFKNDRGQIEGGPDKFIGDLMEAAMSKKGGLDQLSNEGGAGGKAMFGRRSIKMFQALALTYNPAADAVLAAGGSKEDAQKAGAAAVRSEIGKTIATKYDEKDLEKDFSEIMKSSAEQFEAAVRELRMQVGEKLVPALLPLIGVLKDLTPGLVRFTEGVTRMATWAAKNPFLGFGALVTGFFIKELIAAKISQTIQQLISGGKIPTPGVGGGAGPVGGAVSKGVALGVAAGAVIVKSSLGYADGIEGAQDIKAKVDAWNRGDHERGMSPEAAKKKIDEAKGRLAKDTILGTTGDLLTSPFFESSDKAYNQHKADQGLTQSKEGEALMKQIIAALDKNTAATTANTKASGAGGPASSGGVQQPGVPSGNKPIPQR